MLKLEIYKEYPGQPSIQELPCKFVIGRTMTGKPIFFAHSLTEENDVVGRYVVMHAKDEGFMEALKKYRVPITFEIKFAEDPNTKLILPSS